MSHRPCFSAQMIPNLFCQLVFINWFHGIGFAKSVLQTISLTCFQYALSYSDIMTITFHNPDDFMTKSQPDDHALNDGNQASIERKKPQYKRKKAHFIKAIENGESVSAAAESLGLDRGQLYRWRQDDADFDDAWVRAWSAGADHLEEEAIRRAVDGVEKPVFRGGEVVGHVRDYSDSMLMFLLKARRPELFASMPTKTSRTGEKTADENGGSIGKNRKNNKVVGRMAGKAAANTNSNGSGDNIDSSHGEFGDLSSEIEAARRALDRKLFQADDKGTTKCISE